VPPVVINNIESTTNENTKHNNNLTKTVNIMVIVS
jgi:hypothetical protein